MAVSVEIIAEQLKEQIQPLSPTPQDQERRFAQHLLDIGLIDHIPEGLPEGYVSPPPITILGEPLSETIIRERR